MSNYAVSPLRRGSALLASCLLTLASGSAALADDTEVLIGQTLPYAGPNIMFVIDTSGSMQATLLTDDSYDPTIRYPGPANDSSRLYFTTVDSAGNVSYPDANYLQFGAYVETSVFACDAAAAALATDGIYVGEFRQFNDNTGVWTQLGVYDPDPAISGVKRFTECLADEGVHGLDSVSPEVYPVDGLLGPTRLVPWSADPADPDRITWPAHATYAFLSNNFINWIDWAANNGTPVVQTRLEVVQEVTNDLVTGISASASTTQQIYNVGLMRFSTNGSGGMVLAPAREIAVAQNLTDFQTAIGSLTASGATPLSESLYEAYQYFKGGPVTFGGSSSPQLSNPASYDAANNYISPIVASCQKNYVVLLTDGLPVSDDEAGPLLPFTCAGNCLDDLAIYMDQTADMSPLDNQQTVQTYTIGFFTNSQLLQNAATGQVLFDAQGNEYNPPLPGYFTADNVDALRSAFRDIIASINSDVETFTSPAISVNSLNRLTNRDVLYFTMFDPAAKGEPHWDGNLKAYYLGRDTSVTNGDITILDASRREATDASGVFLPNARSIWSAQADGGVVTAGGFASRLSDSRVVVSNITGGTLTSNDNRVTENNSLITAAMLQISDPDPVALEQRRQDLLRFARGVDANGNARKIIGDPLHSQPLIVTYAGTSSEDLALFFTTNDGYFHKVDPTPLAGNTVSDLEEFAFIPKELLKNLNTIEQNLPSTPGAANKVYGLDGPITALIKDDTDFIVDANEKLLVYFGMRRGGTSYYALDLGLGGKSAPRLAFHIQRGSGGYTKLGQTWSAMTPARLRIGGSTKDVLIFGGGYDPAQDNSYGTNEGMGNAVYIADAENGTLLWSASSSNSDLDLVDMKYAIPSDINVLDTNQDGLADRLYFGDMGAQVWRIDIDNDAGGAGVTASGALVASLAGTGSSGERRFYNIPSVARIANTDTSFLTISLGSGYRAHPLDRTIDDRFFMLKDPNVFSPPVDSNGNVVYPPVLTEADLVEVGGNIAPTDQQLAGAGGWYLKLAAAGEKSLSPAVTIDNKVFFTSYSPDLPALTCQPTAAIGVGRLYALDILSAAPALFQDSAGNDVTFVELDRTGIPPAPTLVFTEPACIGAACNTGGTPPPPPPPGPDDDCYGALSEVTMLVATEAFDPQICTAPVRTYWYESDVDADDN